MSNPFLGEIRPFAGNFAPKGWALCNGQLLLIAQNSALFSLLGTTYGGDGKTTFALPNLQGRTAMGMGQGPGLSPRALGEAVGESTVTLTQETMPAHAHAMMGSSATASQSSPAEAVPAASTAAVGIYGTPSSGATVDLASAAIGAAGGSQPHGNMQPYLAVTYIIALQGIFPSRG